ncbi:MAG TPA: phosphoenolpyruvate synthase [Patescibacteria group bacterium]|nr:phosphoenolpyruvate synthase [Patescibacteria group bacterium]
MREVGKREDSKIDFIKWFSELNKSSGSVAGGKGSNLAEMYNIGVPVPPGFVITAQAYDYFTIHAGIKEKIKHLLEGLDYEDTDQLNEVTEKVRELFTSSEFPKEMKEEILEAYNFLNANDLSNATGSALSILKNSSEPVFVAVRSSATTEDLAQASFAGQQESFINIKGNQNLLEAVKKCFASLYTPRATYYRHKQGFKHETSYLAAVVQKMVDADKAGVGFSKDPSKKNNNIIIEAVFGLGEGIVSGSITPDTYIVSEDLNILDKKISDKKIAVTRNSQGETEIIKLKEEKSRQQVLKEYEIKKLAEMLLKLEHHYQKPQDIEFAIEADKIYIVQTRPITTMEKRVGEAGELKGEVLLSGMGASPGIGVGKVKIIKELEDLKKITKGDVLVTRMTNPDMVVEMQKCVAIVTDEGGMTAHAAIVSREMGIPAIVGTESATKILKDGDIITVDGSTGKVYKGKTAETKQKEVLPVTAKTRTKIKLIVDLPSFAKRAAETGVRAVGLTRIEGIIAESGKHPRYFLMNKKMNDYEEVIFKGVKQIAEHFDEVWVRTSDIRSDEFQNLEGAPKQVEANPMLGMHGIRYGIKNPEVLKAELMALKRVAATGKKIGVMMPQLIDVSEVRKVKEFLKEINFTNLRLGVMIETPAAVQIIKEICKEGISFASFGTNDLTQFMLAVDRGNEQCQPLYNEMHPAVLYQLEYVIRVCKRNNVESSICGQAASRKDMVKFLVEKGIDSLSVNADVAKEISDYVEEIEKKLVEGTDLEPRKYQPQKEEYRHGNREEPENNVEEAVEKIEEEKQDYLRENPEEESEDFQEPQGESLDIF